MKPHIEYHHGRWHVYPDMWGFGELGNGETPFKAWEDYIANKCGNPRAKYPRTKESDLVAFQER
jgi:hypothetical protein